MFVRASPTIREPSSPLATPEPDVGTDASFDARWAAWIEGGRQQNLVVARKLRIVLLCAAVVGLLVAVFLGLASGTR